MPHLSDLLTKSVAEFPQQIALADIAGNQLSYQQLDQFCQELTAAMLQEGIQRLDRIGIFLPKSIQAAAAIFATLQLDAVYVPVDVHAPLSRAAYILQDCQARAIWIAADQSEAFKKIFPAFKKSIAFPDHQMELLICEHADAPALDIPEELAYILYTSGSTGMPKGVMITHTNALSFVDWCAAQFKPNAQDVFSSIAPFHFDLSIFDLFVAVKHGAKLLLIDQKAAKNPMLLASLLAEHNVTICYATPTLFKLMLSYGKLPRYDHSALRIVLFAGEVFAIQPLKELKEQWHTAVFYNLYGPTETNVVTWYQVPDEINPDQLQPFPIGKACSNAVCKIWDGEVIEPFIGTEGELIVRGDAVAYGYLNLQEKNEAAFFYETDGTRWYKTGDIVNVDENGDFIFKGRKDRMVKRRGYRIELGEIEAALAHHPNIREAGVVACLDKNSEVSIDAFYSMAPSTEPLNTFQLKEHCLKYIPLYMLPDRFYELQNLPQTSTQKVDYQSLKPTNDD